MKRQFPGVPILGLTATATNAVVADVKKILQITDCVMFKASFNRTNLFYEVSTAYILRIQWFYHTIRNILVLVLVGK